jgi:carboxyl-terminal processing protease
VIGSPTTFGKGTVQRVFDMDKFINDAYDMYKPLGSVKITMQKFYRISGGSTQLRGVTPDIIIPDLYAYLKYGEKEEDFPMGWDEIPKAKYTEWTPAINYKQVEDNSKKRIEAQNTFTVIDNEAKELKQESDNTMETLNLKKYQEQQQKFKDDKKSLDDMQKNATDMSISNLTVDLSYIQSDSTKIARNTEWLKSLRKDIYVNEASKVTADLRPAP